MLKRLRVPSGGVGTRFLAAPALVFEVGEDGGRRLTGRQTDSRHLESRFAGGAECRTKGRRLGRVALVAASLKFGSRQPHRDLGVIIRMNPREAVQLLLPVMPRCMAKRLPLSELVDQPGGRIAAVRCVGYLSLVSQTMCTARSWALRENIGDF
jgi:hypothetical protein